MRSLAEFTKLLFGSSQSVSVKKLADISDILPPISLRKLLEQKVLHQITLGHLTCISTESIFSIFWRLEVFTDGVLEVPLHGILMSESSSEIGKTYLFTTESMIELRKEGSANEAGLFGKIVIGATTCSNNKISFKAEKAHYELQYSVGFRLVPAEYDATQKEIAAFEQSTLTGAWPKISKEELIGDIRKTVANPFHVQQINTPLCGPASIVFELVNRSHPPKRKRQAKRYVRICRQLWETGQFEARTETIKPSDTLIASSLPANENNPGNLVSAADWMLMATLRDTANAIFPIDADSSQFVMGVSTPWEMEDWIFEILGYDQTNYISTFTSGEIDAMRTAQKVWERGGIAFLMIDDALLKGQSAGLLPKHWVAFQGGMVLDETASTISFNCYSWRKNYQVAMKQEDFAEYLFGVVTGES